MNASKLFNTGHLSSLMPAATLAELLSDAAGMRQVLGHCCRWEVPATTSATCPIADRHAFKPPTVGYAEVVKANFRPLAAGRDLGKRTLNVLARGREAGLPA